SAPRRGTGGAGGRTGRDGRWTGAVSVEGSMVGTLADSDAGASGATGVVARCRIEGDRMVSPGPWVARTSEDGAEWATSTSQRSQIRTLEAESRASGFLASSAVSRASRGPG